MTRLVDIANAAREAMGSPPIELRGEARAYLEICEELAVQDPGLVRRLPDDPPDVRSAKEWIELGDAVRSGLLKIEIIPSFWRLNNLEALSAPEVEELVAAVEIPAESIRDSLHKQAGLELTEAFLRLLRDPHAYPLLDAGASEFVNLLQSHGVVIPRWSEERIRATALGTGFPSMLPSFEDATVTEVLEIRRELEKPLIRFRSAVFEMANTVSDVPLSRDFSATIADLYVQVVAPSLEDLSESIGDHSAIRELALGVLDRPSAVVAGAVALATHSIELAIVAGALDRASRAALAAREARRTARRHQFFFLRQVQRAFRR